MTNSSFGRRQAASAAKSYPPGVPPALNPQAEALRDEIAASRPAASGFAAWRRDQTGQRLIIWAITVAVMAPGLISYLIQAPPPISIGLEIGALVVNIWLRRERRRRLKAIVEWEEPDPEAW